MLLVQFPAVPFWKLPSCIQLDKYLIEEFLFPPSHNSLMVAKAYQSVADLSSICQRTEVQNHLVSIEVLFQRTEQVSNGLIHEDSDDV